MPKIIDCKLGIIIQPKKIEDIIDKICQDCGEELTPIRKEYNPFPGESDSELAKEYEFCKRCGYVKIGFDEIGQAR